MKIMCCEHRAQVLPANIYQGWKGLQGRSGHYELNKIVNFNCKIRGLLLLTKAYGIMDANTDIILL
jgi:hypothetical protein